MLNKNKPYLSKPGSRNVFLPIALLAMLSLDILPIAVFAQSELEEIIVTARKREESLQKAPVAVTALTAADIERRGLTDISAIDKVTPNLWFQNGANSAGTSNNAQIFIRGIGQNDFIPTTDPGIGTYINGVYLGRAVGGIFDLVDVERIEVLRGPQGTLFGRNTIGGAVNVVTARPDFEKRSGFVEFKAGNDGWLEGSGVLNLPISSTIASRLSFSVKSRDGYATSTVAPEIDWGNDDKLSLRAALRWRLSSTLEANLTADYYHQDQYSMPSNASVFTGAGLPALHSAGVLLGFQTPPFEFIPGAPQNPTPGLLFPEESFQSSKNGPSRDDGDIGGIALTLDWDAFAWGSIKSITSYREMDLHFIDDNDGYLVETALTDEQIDHWQISQELQLTGQAGKLNWINGFYFFHEKATDDNTVALLPGYVQGLESLPAALFPVTPTSVCPGAFPPNVCAGGAGNPFNLLLDNNQVSLNTIRVDNIAFYTQGTYRFDEKWSLTAGFRFTYEKKELDRSLFRPDTSAVLGLPFFAVAPNTLSDSWTNFSPKAGLEYQINDDALLYASFTQGFRSGTFNGRGSALEAIDTAVDPEEVTSYEIGLKSEFMDRRARANIALYYNDYDDLHISQVTPTSTGGFSIFLLNAASAVTWGGEAELLLLPHDRWQISAGAGYSNAEIKAIDPPVAAASGVNEGAKLRKTPEWTVHIAADYTHPLTAGDLDFHIAYSWRDDVFHGADNAPLTLEDSFGLLDARVSFRTGNGKWEVSAFGSNLTDEVFFNSIFLPAGGGRVNYWARGREYGAGLRYYFE